MITSVVIALLQSVYDQIKLLFSKLLTATLTFQTLLHSKLHNRNMVGIPVYNFNIHLITITCILIEFYKEQRQKDL